MQPRADAASPSAISGQSARRDPDRVAARRGLRRPATSPPPRPSAATSPRGTTRTSRWPPGSCRRGSGSTWPTSTHSPAGVTISPTRRPTRPRPRAALAAWRRELEECFAGRPRHPVFVALADTVAETGLDDAARLPTCSTPSSRIEPREAARLRDAGRPARLLPPLGRSRGADRAGARGLPRSATSSRCPIRSARGCSWSTSGRTSAATGSRAASICPATTWRGTASTNRMLDAPAASAALCGTAPRRGGAGPGNASPPGAARRPAPARAPAGHRRCSSAAAGRWPTRSSGPVSTRSRGGRPSGAGRKLRLAARAWWASRAAVRGGGA